MSELLKQKSTKGPGQSTRFGAALDTVRNSALVNKLKTKTSPLHREILSDAIEFDVGRIVFRNRKEEEKDANARESAAQRAAVAAKMEEKAAESKQASQETVWLSSGQAAKYLGITPRTLYRLINEGQLEGFRFGRVIRLRLDGVDQFVEQSRIQPGDLSHLYQESPEDGGIVD